MRALYNKTRRSRPRAHVTPGPKRYTAAPFPLSAMRIISLNVNGIRSAERRGLSHWLSRGAPWDVVCLQEIRADLDDVPARMRAPRRASSAFHVAERRG